MKWLLNLLAPFRSQIFAMVGVLAVCGLGAAVIAYLHIKRQDETISAQGGRIKDLVEVNKTWASNAEKDRTLRQLEQENTLLLQDKIALIEAHSAATAEQLDKLEASNAEVKEFMGRRIPADLRRLLEQK